MSGHSTSQRQQLHLSGFDPTAAKQHGRSWTRAEVTQHGKSCLEQPQSCFLCAIEATHDTMVLAAVAISKTVSHYQQPKLA